MHATQEDLVSEIEARKEVWAEKITWMARCFAAIRLAEYFSEQLDENSAIPTEAVKWEVHAQTKKWIEDLNENQRMGDKLFAFIQEQRTKWRESMESYNELVNGE